MVEGQQGPFKSELRGQTMKNGRTGFVRSTGDYSRDRHIEFQRNSIYSEFLQMEEELFGGDKTARKALKTLGF